MCKCIGFGKFSKFYWLLIASALMKLLIRLSLKIEYINKKVVSNTFISLLIKPELNDHIFIYFIYHYFGFTLFGIIFLCIKYHKEKNKINYNNNALLEKEIKYTKTEKKQKETSLMGLYNFSKDEKKQYMKDLLLISILYLLSEILIFFFNQQSRSNVYFWMLEIFFIHLFLLKENNYSLYSHQILSFAIIILFGFGIKLTSSFLPQCIYDTQDPEEAVKNMTHYPQFIIDQLKKAIIDSNEKGVKFCKNSFYNISLNDNYYYYFIIIAAFGYLLGFALHSFSIVKIRRLINIKYISPYFIICYIGIFGLILNIIGLIISSNIPCADKDYIKEICHSPKTIIINEKQNSKLYFDSLLSYIGGLQDTLYQEKEDRHKQQGENGRPSYFAIFEILFSILILPALGFFKANFDFFIIKELGVFHLLIPEVIFQIIKDVIVYLFKMYRHINDEVVTLQFIFISISNFLTFIGFAIYLELIELKCCGFDKNTKKNIAIRALIDSEAKEENDDELEFGDKIYAIKERDSYVKSVEEIDKPIN